MFENAKRLCHLAGDTTRVACFWRRTKPVGCAPGLHLAFRSRSRFHRRLLASSAGRSGGIRSVMPQTTNRVFAEVGFGGTYFGVGNFERNRKSDARFHLRVVEQCANGCAANGGIPGLVYLADVQPSDSGSYGERSTWVTRTHTLKVGHVALADDVAISQPG